MIAFGKDVVVNSWCSIAIKNSQFDRKARHQTDSNRMDLGNLY